MKKHKRPVAVVWSTAWAYAQAAEARGETRTAIARHLNISVRTLARIRARFTTDTVAALQEDADLDQATVQAWDSTLPALPDEGRSPLRRFWRWLGMRD